MNKTDQEPFDNSEEITIRDLYKKIAALIALVKSKWLTILCLSIFGAILGVSYASYKRPVYTATSTFVLEDGSKSSGLGQYSSLASLAGVDIGSGGGAFQGDNILELYKSRTMLEKTLLRKDTFDNKEQLLIERYISFNKLRDVWKPSLKNISFSNNPRLFNKEQNSIITNITDEFNNGSLNVSKPDKKLSIINVAFSSKDELFAESFANKLVETVNEFYVQTKIKKSAQNVEILQKQVDSVKLTLNSAISGFASAGDAVPNANPMLQSLRVQPQRKQVDIQVNSGIYTELVKNLEVAKMSLRQEKPLIQIIDAPVLPLKMIRIGKIKGTLAGFLLGLIISTLCIISVKIYQDLIS